MRLPIQITYRNMQKSNAVDRFVRAKAAGLEERCRDLASCRVAVEVPHRHHHVGNLYRVRVVNTVGATQVRRDRGAFYSGQTPHGSRLNRLWLLRIDERSEQRFMGRRIGERE